MNFIGNNTQSVNHTKMFETLYKILMTPEMIKIRKKKMKQSIILYNLQKSLLLLKKENEIDKIDFVEYLKELDKENIKYCQEKII
jgi:hypothetical protein